MNKLSSILLISLLTTLFSFNGISQTFTEQTGISLPGVVNSSVAWGDYDNDGDLDILLNGMDVNLYLITKLYKNNGNNTFSLQTGISFPGVRFGSVSWGDYDKDGNIDILLNGQSSLVGQSATNISKIYRNNGNGAFTDQSLIGLPGLSSSSSAWGDYDNDGDLDILLTGTYGGNGINSYIFRNDGNNSFSPQLEIKLIGVASSSVAWGDYDKDGDLDILLTGSSDSGFVSRVYRNNGNNSFTNQTSIILTGVNEGSSAWGDYDNDGNLDILITGATGYYPNENPISKIYKNNGNNTFAEQYGINLTGVFKSSAAWGDYNNDGKIDILLMGRDNNQNRVSKIYKNIGNNSFVDQVGIGLINVDYGSVAWGDYDNDGDLDIAIVGSTGTNYFSKIYKNNSTVANISPTVPNGLTSNVQGNAIVFRWNKSIDDNTPTNAINYNIKISSSPFGIDLCSPQSNITNGFHKIVQKGTLQDTFCVFYPPFSMNTCSKIYWSVQALDQGFQASNFSSIDSINNILLINGKGDTTIQLYDTAQLTVIHNSCINTTYSWSPTSSLNNANIQSPKAFPLQQTTYYVTVTEGQTSKTDSVKIDVTPFKEQTGIGLIDVYGSSVAWGDYDNDGDLDILLTGYSSSSSVSISKIYKNNGNKTFTEQTGISLTGVSFGSSAWGDYDNDGDLDILLTGSLISKIYRNNGNNTFTEQTAIHLTAVEYSSVAWGDYDNDGDLDILLCGSTSPSSPYNPITKVYRNNGNNTFTDQLSIILPSIYNAKVEWADLDNDADLDIFLSGATSSTSPYNPISKIYRNDGGNSFTEMSGLGILGMYEPTVAMWDYDNDGDLDILISGGNLNTPLTKLYNNHGNFNFTEIVGLGLQNSKSVEWGDFDNDGKLDILMANADSSRIYKNVGNNAFVEQTQIKLKGVFWSSLAWGDYDNNGNLDILLTGFVNSQTSTTKIYSNNSLNPNISPSTPTGLTTQFFGNYIKFSWNNALDNTTPTSALTYNIRMGSSPSGLDLCSPQSDLSNGYRRIVEKGNILDTFCLLQIPNSLNSCSTIYWSVQAIDNGFKASSFSNSANFINPLTIDAINDTLIQAFDTIQISVNHNACSPVSYSWSPSNSLDSQNIQSPKIFPTKSTTYYVTVTEGLISRIDSVLILVNPFTKLKNTNMNFSGAMDLGDYDNDGKLDLFVSPRICKNNGDSTFTQTVGLFCNDGVGNWADYDNDNDLDIMLAGFGLIRNDGNASFNNSWSCYPALSGSISKGDYDNDGDLDCIFTGHDPSNLNNASRIYKNKGNNVFIEQTNILITEVEKGATAWGDYDNDGDLDLLLTGLGSFNPISKIYKNNGDESFTEQIGISLTGVFYSSAEWGDYDNDGDLDILITGTTTGLYTDYLSKIYRNNGNNTFTEQTGINLKGVCNGSAKFGDYDNDGDLDILLYGIYEYKDFSYNYCAKIYRNNNNNSFYEERLFNIPSKPNGGALWGDLDNNGYLDIIVTGNLYKIYPNPSTEIYFNNTNKSYAPNPNTPPSTPIGLISIKLNDSTIKFSWNKSIDNTTPSQSLTYNLRIGVSQNGVEICSPQSDLNTGFRRIVEMGSIQDTFFVLKVPTNLGTCLRINASVQAIDYGFMASNFSTASSDIYAKMVAINTDFNAIQSTFPTPPFETEFTNSTPNLGDYNFNWYFGDGTFLNSNDTIVNHVYTSNGSFSVSLKATHKNGNCSDSILKSNYISCNGLGIENSESNLTFSLFPNPNNGDFTLSINGIVNSNYQISISSIVGEEVYAEALKASGSIVRKEIHLSQLAKGMYFLSVVTENAKIVKRVIIQ